MFRGNETGTQMPGQRTESRNVDETLDLGRRIGRELRGGEVVLLSGTLGAGKSVVARAIGEVLGATGWRGSPTFTLVNEYATQPALYHADLYRLAGAEVEDLGLEEYVRSDAILLIEWPERAPEAVGRLPASRFVQVEIGVVGRDARVVDVSQTERPRQ